MNGAQVLVREQRRERLFRTPSNSTSIEAAAADLPQRSKPPFRCTMAYQPIVDVVAGRTVAYEALARGLHNEPASTALREAAAALEDEVDDTVEQRCGTLAVEMAATLGLLAAGTDLYVNFSPTGGAFEGSALCSSVEAAERAGLPLGRLILEITEREPLRRPAELRAMLAPFCERGLRLAMDDFGAGYAGLSTLAEFHPEIVKVDIALTRGVAASRTKRVILQSILTMCCQLGIEVIAEGVEETLQRRVLEELGVRYMQGNLFSEPGFERLPVWPPA